ncbi:MAG TPA: hypothetical protein DCM87_00830 [Planctomycetes bacterium]|nr:hypothetical protein [Planctomycetota bacterium]
MAMRLSNRERIKRRAMEFARAAEEKEVRPPRKSSPRAKRVVAPKRVKLVWKVFNEGFKEMACFPYSKEAEAKEKAAALAKRTGKAHFVNGVKVAMEESAVGQ